VFANIFGLSTYKLGHLDTMSNSGDFEAVAADIRKILHQPEYDDGSAGPVLVRLAWHSAGTYCAETDTGGSNGAGMRYEVIC
jgi:cytochrome c peroxidase